MFGKKKCKRCDEKISKDFDFCPFCGTPVQNNENNYGLLGKNDNIGDIDRIFNKEMDKPSFMDKMITGAFNSAIKIVEKEIMKEQKQNFNNQNKLNQNPNNQNIHTDFQLFINGQKVPIQGNMGSIRISESPSQNMGQNRNIIKEKHSNLPKISEEILKKSSKLPRKEAKSKVSRLGNNLIYELDTPGLDSVENVLINQLENSLEVKAYTEKAVFFKTLPNKLALLKYTINPKEGKLFLEFKAG